MRRVFVVLCPRDTFLRQRAEHHLIVEARVVWLRQQKWCKSRRLTEVYDRTPQPDECVDAEMPFCLGFITRRLLARCGCAILFLGERISQELQVSS